MKKIVIWVDNCIDCPNVIYKEGHGNWKTGYSCSRGNQFIVKKAVETEERDEYIEIPDWCHLAEV